MTTTFDQIDTAVDEMNRLYPDMGFWHPHAGTVEITRMDRHRCGGCGQQIPTGNPRPDRWIDYATGEVLGGHDHSHGCGHDNRPLSVLLRIDSDRDVWDQLGEGIAELLLKVQESIDGRNAEIRSGLVDRLRHAVDAVRRIEADTEPGKGRDDAIQLVLDGNDEQPGAFRETDGSLVVWDWSADPMGFIEVGEDDLVDADE